ncbi:Chitin synthase chs-2 [Anthophora plagiata]
MSNLNVDNLNSSFVDLNSFNDNFSEMNDTMTQNSLFKESLSWDIFKYLPLEKESASMQYKKWLNTSIRTIKVFVYIILFCIVLCSGLTIKFVVLFAISQLDEKESVYICDYHSEYNEQLEAMNSKKSRIIWTWYIIYMFLVPESFTIFRAIWYFLFKKKIKLPRKQSIAILLILETFHPIGVACLIFYSFPKLNSVDAAAISSCVCFIPALLNLFCQYQRNRNRKMFILILLCNILTLISQGVGLFLPSFLIYDLRDPATWILPIALLLSSCRWWSNYVSHYSHYNNGFMKYLATVKMDLKQFCYVLEGYIALWRCLIFISTAIVISVFKDIQIQEFFELIWRSEYSIELVEISNPSSRTDVLSLSKYFETSIDKSTPLYTFLIQIFGAFLIYEAAIFAYQTQMHKFGFAFPISLVTPVTIVLTILFCAMREQDPCAFHDLIPDYLFLKIPKYNSMIEFLLSWRIWCWIIWWLSQIWITLQLWLGENQRLAPVGKIFYHFSYDSFITDQFLGLNKSRHEKLHKIEEEELSDSFIGDIETDSSKESQNFNNYSSTLSSNTIFNKKGSYVPQIYACATMWHENKEEMNELIGSILRLDKDQCAMRVTQKYYKIFIKDYYELETHIAFDDAFCCIHGCVGPCDHNENEIQINNYVATFVETMQENIRHLGILDVPPIKCPTPYGGQLIWNLPGNTHLTVHLKDKNKIRHRKRWSQVMYMYYLLGYRLMGTSIDIDTKEILADNTYILTLDGDVDFRPAAVKGLIDLMKKDKELGAACGRIHPIGKGLMIWLQKFEYAVGHWLQKSTEHTIGSVLCSPGCFSLFRAKALMQHNVIAKYAIKSTEPNHYIQYDQGEDRWLCTLILQAGCKVEYCAASDAYTHAPESFKEFYIQRRRWIPSTIANLLDLLGTSSRTRKLNDNISWLYVTYQWILTGSTIIGPSFIYLMMVGAFVTSFHIDNWPSFFFNLIPIIVFVFTCFFYNVRIQLVVAEIITVLYGLVMIVVLIGVVLQIASDGEFAPTTLLFFTVMGQFVIAAFLHPQEISCLPHAIIYYITVPSMYMLLIIFSIFNVHNITWGTRESKSERQLSEKQNTKMNKLQSEQHGEAVESEWTKIPLSNLFRCVFCMYRSSEKEEKYLESIYNSINEINLRLSQIESNYKLNYTPKDNIEERSNGQSKTPSEQVKSQVIEDLYTSTDSESETTEEISASGQQEYSNYFINPYWLQDERLGTGKVDFLSSSEEQFWKQLIRKYLYPIENDAEKQKQIAKGLINIRNECLLKFFMINILFIVAIFLMQINKDVFHFQWPFGITYQITYVDDYEAHVYKNHMHLEPIGCLFILAFVSILFIQFLAMLVHQFNTFLHIIANVKLNYNDKDEHSVNDLISSKHAKTIADELQSTIKKEVIFNMEKNVHSLRKHKTVKELTEDTKSPQTMLPNFEVFFNEKLRGPNTSDFSKKLSLSIPKHVMEAFEKNRSNILTGQKKVKDQNNVHNKRNNNNLSKYYVYDNPTFLNDKDE